MDLQELQRYIRELLSQISYLQRQADRWRGIAAEMGYEPNAHKNVRPTSKWLLSRIHAFKQQASSPALSSNRSGQLQAATFLRYKAEKLRQQAEEIPVTEVYSISYLRTQAGGSRDCC